MKRLTGLMALPVLAGAAFANDKPDFGKVAGTSASPFAYARSGAKAKHLEKVLAEAAAGGGKVIGGQEAATGA